MKRAMTIGMALALAAPLLVFAAEPPKDPNPAQGSPGGIPVEATGGPDAFGYTFIDQAEPNCAFQFVDISATGTSITTGDDSSSGAIPLGAPFNFYGTVFNSLNMATNGYISTDPTDTGPDLSNDCPLPTLPSTGGGARFYPLHDDLITTNGLTEYFPACPRSNPNCPGLPTEDCTVYQWEDVTHFGGTEPPWNFQAILYHQSGDFVYQTGPGNPEAGSGSTTGIQDAPPPTTGLTYACNVAASVPDNTAVCFIHPTPAPICTVVQLPPTVEIPTANHWGLGALFLALVAAAVYMLRRRSA